MNHIPFPIEDAAELLQRFIAVRNRTMRLCEPLQVEDHIPQPMAEASPPKWNIAHTTWFFEEMVLKQFVRKYQPFDENFGYLFNSYYDSIGERSRRDKRSLSRPSVEVVFEYRRYVDEKIAEFLSSKELTLAAAELIVLGINHEQQHQELFLTDLKYAFGQNPLYPIYDEGWSGAEAAESQAEGFVSMPAGVYEIGHTGEGFCFDNERYRHKVYLGEYQIDRYLVKNSDYLLFIADGGYRNFRFWHSEGWELVQEHDLNAPMYWHKINGEWYQYTLAGLKKLNLNVPVCHISYFEAAAYAEYRGMRLPTEFEWEAASSEFDWGLRWEWTNSAYLPYPGFVKAPGAVGEYNGKFMINQMVLRGASIATPPGHSRNTYRNFFHPHARWQFSGIRLAR